MTPVDFLRAVWPDNGYYCLATHRLLSGASSRIWVHKVFDTIDAAATYAAGKTDIYFCVHSLKNRVIIDENGKKHYRQHKNMQEAQVFFFDIDVGVGKPYATQREAGFALKAFCDETHMPKPLVISSGGGLHVYWRIDTPLLSHEWKTHAARLRLLAEKHGLGIDPSRVVDISSVLRVVGTYNSKDKTKLRPVKALIDGPVTPLDDFIKLLSEAVIRSGATETPCESTERWEAPDLFADNTKRTYDGPPPTGKAVLLACPQMRWIATKKEEVSQPAWYFGGVGVMLFTDRDEANVHKISQGDPRYTPEATDAKIAQWRQKDLGPTTCLKMAEVCGEERCQKCAFKGRGGSPVVWARKLDEAPPPIVEAEVSGVIVTTEIPAPPKPYRRTKEGGVTFLAKNKEGDESVETVYPYDIYPLSRQSDKTAKREQHIWRVHLPHEEPMDLTLDADLLYDDRKLSAALANQGVFANDVKGLRLYMTAYIIELQRRAAAEAQHSHLGWTSQERNKFVLADITLQQDGTAVPSSLGRNARNGASGMRKAGSGITQIKLLKHWSSPRYVAQQFYILNALAAPIFYATGFAGVIINASGEAGAGKSTALYTAAAMWGDPEIFTLGGGKNRSTEKGRLESMSVLANIPICIDEITKIDPEVAKNLALDVSQPGPRTTLGRDGVLKPTTDMPRSTIMLSTANSSLHALLSTDNAAGTAGSMRVVEITFEKTPDELKPLWDAYMRELRLNYGHIGEAYMRYVIQNLPAIEKRVHAVMKMIDIDGRLAGAERFWGGALACVIVSGEIACKLALLNWNIVGIKEWALNVLLPKMRGAVAQEYHDPVSILTDYLGNIVRNTHLAKSDQWSGNIPSLLREVVNAPIYARYNMDDSTMWVSRAAFQAHCARIRACHRSIIDQLVSMKIVKKPRSRYTLSRGADVNTGQSWCFSVDMRHPEVAGVEQEMRKGPDPRMKHLRVVEDDE